MDASTFRKMFRLDRPLFDELINIVEPFLKQCDEGKARNSSGSPILITTRVAVTLCWLAGASHLDLSFAPGISSSTFYNSRGALWPTIKAINMAFKVDCWMDVS